MHRFLLIRDLIAEKVLLYAINGKMTPGFDEIQGLPPTLPPRSERDDRIWVIERSLRSYESLLDAHICIHDVSGLFSSADGEALLLPSRIVHQAPLCRHHHTQQCISHCAEFIHEQVRQQGAHRFHCWKGASEFVHPILKGQMLVGIIYVGLLRGKKPIKRLPASVHSLRLQLSKKHALDDEALSDVLVVLAGYLIAQIEEAQGDTTLPEQADDRQSVIARWIRNHMSESVCLGDLAQHLSLSQSRCSHLVHEIFGISFSSLLLRERLERARRLLIHNPFLSIRQVADKAGFGDERHFSRMFKRRFAHPPGRYRGVFKSQV